MVSADTYHLYIEGIAMIPEGTAFEKILRDDNVQGANLEQFPISYRGGHRLRSLSKKLPEKANVELVGSEIDF